MSLVIATNKDQDNTFRQEQSIFSAYSFRNALSSVYKIPANSQVCLQSAKVNLDGRNTITGNNSIYYDWFGTELDQADSTAINKSTSYPILQQIGESGKVLELTADELAERIKARHREYHPNRKAGGFDCDVKRNSGLDFLGYDFKYTEQLTSSDNKPATFQDWGNYWEQSSDHFVYLANGKITRNTGERQGEPCVGIGSTIPISLINGSMKVDIDNANASSVPWGCGLSRYVPAPEEHEDGLFAPPYFDAYNGEEMGLGDADHYYEDFGVHRNEAGELVVRHATPFSGDFAMTEIEYWKNASSGFSGSARYNLSTGDTQTYKYIRFQLKGEQIEVFIGPNKADGEDIITTYLAGQPKESYFKPISQTSWCLHPVLYVGRNGTSQTNHIHMNHYTGLTISGYNPAKVYTSGWYETMSLLSADYNSDRALANCKEVDMRAINDPDDSSTYAQKGLNASGTIDYKPAMINLPNKTYYLSEGAGTDELFGFAGRSLVNTGNISGGTITFSSDTAPSQTSIQSIFVRLNGFGQQVLNARTGNKSTILSHLPTGDSRAITGTSGRFFYEPNRDVWLDLNNPYEIQTSEFGIDFVYSNEQYAKILQGQSIVVLYFREKPTSEGYIGGIKTD